jgi:hypothetical protein
MSRKEPPIDPVWDTPLTSDEFARRESASVASVLGPDGDDMLALYTWFVRKYPTPLARLKYVRRQTASVLAAGRVKT